LACYQGGLAPEVGRRHLKKLRPGDLQGNRFRIVLRDVGADRDAVEAHLKAMASQGVPNCFGAQRSGFEAGTDNIPVLSQVAQPGPAMQQPQAMSGARGSNTAHAGHTAPAAQAYEGLNTPSVWRTNRTHAAAKVDALASTGMDEIEIPAFLRKQAD
jgi:hypothetical protein